MELREDGPCYIEFEVREMEDRAATQDAGHYVPRDVDFIIATPPGGNLTLEKPAEKWIAEKRKAGDPNADYYERAYKAWKEGQEEPVEGTPVRSCPIFSPAQVKQILQANIRTVEDLRRAPEEALQRMGMGARALQQKADAYLDAAENNGKVAEEVVTLRRDNEDLKARVEELTERVKALSEPKKKGGRPKKAQEPKNSEDRAA